MFETVESAEIPIPPVFGRNDLRFWAYVQMRLHIPWFYVTYRFDTEDGMTMRNMYLLSKTEQLRDAVQERNIEIDEVHIVLPSHMTGKHTWSMEPLVEIWQGIEPESDGQPAYIYVAADRTRYVFSMTDTQEADLRNKELIYAVPKASFQTTR